eukprot:TRINITY_DN3796_c0_g1_i1.p1 TRINITY_DN3796_c0_g1~~TRINITY_DN3796_c0_g1_i1.p1  ORF type:complete len:1003 (+),score=246.48 TRINITY_DN3796_c0_g1_i1:133-3141(+)
MSYHQSASKLKSIENLQMPSHSALGEKNSDSFATPKQHAHNALEYAKDQENCGQGKPEEGSLSGSSSAKRSRMKRTQSSEANINKNLKETPQSSTKRNSFSKDADIDRAHSPAPDKAAQPDQPHSQSHPPLNKRMSLLIPSSLFKPILNRQESKKKATTPRGTATDAAAAASSLAKRRSSKSIGKSKSSVGVSESGEASASQPQGSLGERFLQPGGGAGGKRKSVVTQRFSVMPGLQHSGSSPNLNESQSVGDGRLMSETQLSLVEIKDATTDDTQYDPTSSKGKSAYLSREEIQSYREMLKDILTDEEKKKNFREFLVKILGKDTLLMAFETFNSFEKQNSKVSPILIRSIAQALWDTVSDSNALNFPQELVQTILNNLKSDKFDPENVFRPAKEYIFDLLSTRLLPKYKCHQELNNVSRQIEKIKTTRTDLDKESARKKSRLSLALISPRSSPEKLRRKDSVISDKKKDRESQIEGKKLKKRKTFKEQRGFSKLFSLQTTAPENTNNVPLEEKPKDSGKPRSEMIAEQLIEELELSESLFVPDQILSPTLPPQTQHVINRILDKSQTPSNPKANPITPSHRTNDIAVDANFVSPIVNNKTPLTHGAGPLQSPTVAVLTPTPPKSTKTPGLTKSMSQNAPQSSKSSSHKQLARLSSTSSSQPKPMSNNIMRLNRNHTLTPERKPMKVGVTGPSAVNLLKKAEPVSTSTIKYLSTDDVSLNVASLVSPRILNSEEHEDHDESERFELLLQQLREEAIEKDQRTMEDEILKELIQFEESVEDQQYEILKAKLEQLQKQAEDLGIEPTDAKTTLGQYEDVNNDDNLTDHLRELLGGVDLPENELTDKVQELLDLFQSEELSRAPPTQSPSIPLPLSSISPLPLSFTTPMPSTSSLSLPFNPSELGITTSASSVCSQNALPPISPQSKQTEEQRWVILRKYQAPRGGVKLWLPGTLEELIEIGSKLLHIPGVKVREVETEAVILDISAIQTDVLYLTTAEEEKLL